ncbi:hypothetical protein GDO81_004569 [Engystomops pustulosus]|uniref:WAP domain-containing protein n=1 Tax=Engystomops pustulosus TaxID=76066 RepID=A0AAV6ZX04_ENGPU|nr:hypothetical protein GDO81_004569 [Engystomops pustulosus]
MDTSMKFVILILSGNLALSISQEEPNWGVENVRKPGGCPKVEEGHPISMCSNLCADKENCTVLTCDDDSQCEGSLKCCKTKCGTECLPPVFKSPCESNFDCPWTLKCCGGVCDSDCVHQPRKSRLGS